METLKKAGHLLLFALFGFAVRRSRRVGLLSLQLVVLLGVAAVVELLQLFAMDRTPLPLDALINVVGSFVGWVVGPSSLHSPSR